MSTSTSVEDVEKFNNKQLKKFLQGKNLNLTDNDFRILRDQDVDGSVFVDLTYEQLVNRPFEISGGKAMKLTKVIKELNSQKQPVAVFPGMYIKVVDLKLTNFWKALKNTLFYMDDDDLFFELSGESYFFGKNSEPSKLFIRECYNDLLDVVFDDNVRRLRISGNPGIGKTFFGYYLLYHLAILDHTVIYEIRTTSELSRVILFDHEEAFSLNKTLHTYEISRYLDDSSVWYIVDGKDPDIVEAKTILICSPLKAHYKEFNKKIPTVRYMPVWSWNEINICRSELFKNLSVDKVHKLFKKWGGIPRYVLAGALEMDVQLQLKDAIDLCDEKIFRYIGGSDSKHDVSHKLVHIWTNLPERDDDEIKDDKEIGDGEKIEYYTQKTIKFASDYVVEEVTRNVKRIITDKLFMDLDEVLKGGKSNSVLGSYFESIAHQMLRQGGNFIARSLDSNEEHTLMLPQWDEHRFSNINEIKTDMYCQPIDKTFPSIDAIYAPDSLFQMTTSLNHPIKMIGLNKLRSKLVKQGNIDFYFVVPAQLFDKYRKQNYATAKGRIATKINPWINNQIKQHVLKIDLDSGSSLVRMSSTATIEEGISTLSTADKPSATADESLVGISTSSTADEPLITPLADDTDPSTVPAKRLPSDIEREGGSKKRSKKRKKQKKHEF